jgi:hypothetical protein
MTQLTSHSEPPRNAGPAPIVTPEQDSRNDVLESYRPSYKEIPSNPTPAPSQSGSPFAAQYEPRVHAVSPPVQQYMVPSGIRNVSVDVYDGKEDPIQDESQFIVAGQLPHNAPTPPRYESAPPTPRAASANPLREKIRKVRVPEELLSPEALLKRIKNKEYQRRRALGPGQV